MEVVSFKYNGGSEPGKTRRILVTHKDKRIIGGYDIDKQAYRNFLKERVSELQIIDASIVSMGDMPDRDRDLLEDFFSDRDFNVYRTNDYLVAIAEEEVVVSYYLYKKEDGDQVASAVCWDIDTAITTLQRWKAQDGA